MHPRELVHLGHHISSKGIFYFSSVASVALSSLNTNKQCLFKPQGSSQSASPLLQNTNIQFHHQYGQQCRKLLLTPSKMCLSSPLASSIHGTQEVKEKQTFKPSTIPSSETRIESTPFHCTCRMPYSATLKTKEWPLERVVVRENVLSFCPCLKSHPLQTPSPS